MAIFGIMALGVGVFAGVTTANPSMIVTAQQYIEEQRLFDFRLISTWGFTEEEVDQINHLDAVGMARGGYTVDFIYVNENGDEQVLRTYSICNDINRLTLVAGRLPASANEIVLDSDHFPSRMIGEEIRIFCYGRISVVEENENTEDNEDTEHSEETGHSEDTEYSEETGHSEDTEHSEETEYNGAAGHNEDVESDRDAPEEALAYESFVITGLVRSPMYMNLERGVTTIGNGRVSGFGYLLPEAFTGEFYHQVYVYLESDYLAFTQEYNDEIRRVEGNLEDAILPLIEQRMVGEIEEARRELDEAKKELELKIFEMDEELRDALISVEEGEEELARAKEELEEAREEIEEGLEELEEAYQELTDARRSYQSNRETYTEQRRLFTEAETEFQTAYAAFQESRRQFEQQRDEYRRAVAAEEIEPNPAIEEQIASYEEQFTEGAAAFATRRAELETVRTTLAELSASLYEGGAGFEEAEASIEEGREELEELLLQLEEAFVELEEQEEALVDARIEIEERKITLEEEVAQARVELEEAGEKLYDVTDVRLFVLSRHTNVGYAYFEGDIEMVDSIARVFPIFFLLIAALVCSTTMTRMIDEERTQIGTYLAMGVEKGAILAKYIIYSGSAAVLGGVVGFFVGTQVFPRTIWLAYSMLYGFGDNLILVIDYWLLLICLVVALLCSVGMTFLACRLELRKAPAQLIRPKMPPQGKRVWLERIPFIWNDMRFLYKVTARNVFRFKKRMFMMIIGIAGCMALVLAGLGLRDSVNGVIDAQYTEILHFDITGSFSRGISETFLTELEENYGTEIEQQAVLMRQVVTINIEDVGKRVNLLIEKEESLDGLMTFRDHGGEVGVPGRGEIAIDNRLARAGNFNIGDEIILQIGDNPSIPVRISGIFENYVLYYARMSAETFEDIFEEEYYVPNIIKLSLQEGADDYLIASWIGGQSGSTGVLVVSTLRSQVGNMLDSLDYIVMLIIGSAALLALIVLYNLGNINISERVREIATLKVLGFFPRETASYVFRENFILTLIGMGLGVPLGILFHNFMISQIHIDMLSFQVIIHPISYLIAIVIVFVFSIVVDMILRKKLEKIKMAESLKAVE